MRLRLRTGWNVIAIAVHDEVGQEIGVARRKVLVFVGRA